MRNEEHVPWDARENGWWTHYERGRIDSVALDCVLGKKTGGGDSETDDSVADMSIQPTLRFYFFFFASSIGQRGDP